MILFAVAFGSAEDSPATARFFATRSTYTRVRLVTQTELVTKPVVCASLVDVTGACRRKRGISESADILPLAPTPVHRIERTLAPVSEVERDVDIESSSHSFEEVDIIGMDPFRCNPEARFNVGTVRERFNNITLRFYVKMNATLTVTQTTVEGTKPFIVSGCTPIPFTYKICGERGTAEKPAETPVAPAEEVSTDTEEPAQAIYEEPIPQDPVYQEPIPEESVHEEPIPEEPVYEELIPQAPVYEEPIPEEPVYEEPIPEEPIYEEPIPEEPIYEEPIPEKDVPEEPIAEELIQGERAAPVEPVRRLASFRVPSRNWGL